MSKEIYNWRKSHKVCTKCGQENAKQNHTLCWRCLANANDYSRIYYFSHGKRSDEQRQRDKECQKRYVEERFEKGLCFKCGKYPSINGSKYSMCVQCNAKNAAKKRERMRKKGALPWILRGDGLYCFHCCKPVCKGKKLCRECYEKMCENLRAASEKGRTSPDNWHNKKFDFHKRIKEE